MSLLSRSNISSCSFLPLRVRKPLFTDASIAPRSRGVRFFVARFVRPPRAAWNRYHSKADWNRATIYAETKRVHEQHSERRALECGLKNCGKHNVMCNTKTMQTIGWSLIWLRSHYCSSAHQIVRERRFTREMKMWGRDKDNRKVCVLGRTSL